MSMEVTMPKYVDSQNQILWWESDEFVIAITIFGIGLMLHAFLTPIIAMVFVGNIMSRFKRASLDGAAMHSLCYTGFVPMNDEFDNSLEKEFYL